MNQAFFSLLNQILVLIFLMAAGYAAQKMKFIDQDTLKAISSLILQVTLPALIISSMQFPFSSELLGTSLKIILISVISYAFIITVSYGYVRLVNAEGKKRDVLQFLLIFSNVSFMGFPVIHVLYGDLGVFYTALFNIPFNVLLMTLGVMIMSRSTRQAGPTDFKRLFRNPGTIAVMIGFGFFLFSVSLPSPLLRSLEMIGNTTTPLSMIFIGSLLAEVPVRSMFGDRQLYLVTLVRLLLIPLLIFIPLKLMGMEGLMLGIPVIIFAMPGAVLTGAFARLYDSDYFLASKAIFFTTLCSIITIPLWAMLF
jgi:malate permease and related proteins